MKKNNVKLNGTPSQRLTECRKAANLTQAELSHLSGYSIQHISRIENGKQRLTYETAEELCKHLNTTPQYLLCKEALKNKESFYELMDPACEIHNMHVKDILQYGNIGVNYEELFNSAIGILSHFYSNCTFDPEFSELVEKHKDKKISISIPTDLNLNHKTIEVSQYSLILLISDIFTYIRFRSSEFIKSTGNKSFSELFDFNSMF